MVVPVFAEADAGRDGDPGVLQYLLGEFQRAHGAVGLGDLRPDVHRGLRDLDRPAGLVQALHHHVAALLVLLAVLLDAFLRAFERDDGGHLDRREGAVVVVALHARQRVHHLGVTHHVADAPAGHVVALGHGEELHGDLARARYLHDRGRPVPGGPAVEHDVGVGEVVYHQDVVLCCERDDALEELQLDAPRRGIAREPEDHHLRLREGFADRAFELLEEIHPRGHAHRTDVRAGDDGAVDVDRIARVGHQHRVAPLQRREHQVREALLRADGDDRLGVRVEQYAVAPLVPAADRAAQARNALGDRVAVRVLALRRLDQLVDDVPGRGAVRIAHAHVDDVLAGATGRHLQLVGDVEDVGRKALDPGKISHGEACRRPPRGSGARRCSAKVIMIPVT